MGELPLQLILRNLPEVKLQAFQPVQGARRAELVQHPRQQLLQGLTVEPAEAMEQLTGQGLIPRLHLQFQAIHQVAHGTVVPFASSLTGNDQSGVPF